MPVTYQSVKIFLSCPSDVSKEKELALKTIHKISTVCKETLGIALEPVDWNDFLPKTPQLPDKRIQNILNSEIPKCQIFLLILWKRYGSSEPGYRKSNTEREVKVALDVLKKEKKLMFLSYFHRLDPERDKGPQRKSVENFRMKLEEKGVWFKQYSTPNDFYDLIIHDLYRTIFRIRLSTNKHKYLSRFWIFGQPDRPTTPLLGIFYPSINRTFMGPSEDKNTWLNRLEPNIVFEDFKALQKIEKTLRVIGFREFKIYNNANIPPDMSFMNRFWICLPRNKRGLEQANRYTDVSRFTMIRGKNRADSFIKWKTSTHSNSYILVRSPLAKYLREQRVNLNITGEWGREMDQIIAKDYAILARFKDTFSNTEMTEGALKDYFLAGIRGLGTWGAAWFIDRRYSAFKDIKETEDFQFLLEIEYRNGKINNVIDVSHQSQAYFDKENRINTVRRNIQNFVNI